MRWLRMSLGGLTGMVGLAVVTVCSTSGCSSIGYYGQSVSGHLSLLNSAKPVDDWLADPATPPALRERLVLATRMRDFAVSELKLPDNASYRRYADLKRPAAVWNLSAAPELSLVLKTWCFPVVGCVGYRGYYDPAPAEALAAQLRAEGFEATVYPVPAYSTLGRLPSTDYFSDPLLNTFIRNVDSELARLVFHELAHQVAYAEGDTPFNESFATAVERLGSRLWLERHGTEAARLEAQRIESRREDFRELTWQTRVELDAMYRRSDLSDDDKRIAKAEIMARMRAGHAALKAGPWKGYAGYDGWFERANNATLGMMGAYNDLVPQFEALFEAQGRDFDRFYAEVRRIAALPRESRRAALAAALPEERSLESAKPLP